MINTRDVLLLILKAPMNELNKKGIQARNKFQLRKKKTLVSLT